MAHYFIYPNTVKEQNSSLDLHTYAPSKEEALRHYFDGEDLLELLYLVTERRFEFEDREKAEVIYRKNSADLCYNEYHFCTFMCVEVVDDEDE